MSEVRVRFAPSPTGQLHIGNVRTALYNWLFARHKGGKFLLRIEDTDRARSGEEYIKIIFESLQWLGINWDEPPVRQSQRLNIYNQYLKQLISEGKAYRCNCSPERLEAVRAAQVRAGQKPQYDGKCRELNLGEDCGDFVVRFRMPKEGSTEFTDLIRGEVKVNNEELDDLVLRRVDGLPTYNYAVVIDDYLMGITDVIRGDDHLANTPKQINLYYALGWKPPRFAHLPMILGLDHAPLSKRHGALSVLEYREHGYLPEAVINFLARLGWGCEDQEVFTVEELIEKFTLERVAKSPAIWNLEKLLWLNGEHIRSKPVSQLVNLWKPWLESQNWKIKDENWLGEVVKTLQPRCKTLEEMTQKARFYFEAPTDIPEDLRVKFLSADMKNTFGLLISSLQEVNNWNMQDIEQAFHHLVENSGLKLKSIAQPVRVALTGSTTSPGLYEIMWLLGKEEVLNRLQRAYEVMR